MPFKNNHYLVGSHCKDEKDGESHDLADLVRGKMLLRNFVAEEDQESEEAGKQGAGNREDNAKSNEDDSRSAAFVDFIVLYVVHEIHDGSGNCCDRNEDVDGSYVLLELTQSK